MINKDIDKSKLVLIRESGETIEDIKIETKEIGYYQDSWNRFKKNKASLTAFYIICFMLFFIIFGPWMKNYDLPKTNGNEATRLAYLTPKIPGLEKLGIFDGTKTITLGKQFVVYMYNSDFEDDIILEGMPQELIDDPNAEAYADITNLEVKVDYYKYINFIKSVIPSDYFAIVDQNASNGYEPGDIGYVDPLGSVSRTLEEEEFAEAVAKNYILEIISVTEQGVDDEKYYQYNVRVNEFLYALDQTPEDTYFWFGTNASGEDLFTELWVGARISVFMALTVVVINAFIGLMLGAIAGYYGGAIDLLMDRIVEILASIPLLSVITLMVLRYGSEIWIIIIAFTLTNWIGNYATARMQFYRFKNREYVLAARTLGAKDSRIMFKHIFPNTLGLLVTRYALSIPVFVFTEANFSFLGIIDYSNATSVGMLINQGQDKMGTYPHLLLFPAIYISILMIAFNLFGNGLRDAFNPSLRGVE